MTEYIGPLCKLLKKDELIPDPWTRLKELRLEQSLSINDLTKVSRFNEDKIYTLESSSIDDNQGLFLDYLEYLHSIKRTLGDVLFPTETKEETVVDEIVITQCDGKDSSPLPDNFPDMVREAIEDLREEFKAVTVDMIASYLGVDKNVLYMREDIRCLMPKWTVA